MRSIVDWSALKPTRQPTRAERGRYHQWRKYLKDSKLTLDEQHHRAAEFAEQGRLPPKD